MLELFQNLNDDQTALLGCAAALIGASLMLVVSFHSNPNNRKQSTVEAKPDSVQEEITGDHEQRRAA